MAITLSTPPRILQTEAMSCWAASFESWRNAVGARDPLRVGQDGLIELFRQIEGYVAPNGGATGAGIRGVGHLALMNLTFVRGTQLTPDYFEKRLRADGHIYLAYRPLAPGQSGGHVVVVYGVTDQHVLVMDPDASVLFPCHAPFSWFLSKTDAWVGTSMFGNPANLRNPFTQVGR